MNSSRIALQRIRRSLLDIERLLETNSEEQAYRLLRQTKVNLYRIRTTIRNDKFMAIESCLENLELYCGRAGLEDNSNYAADRINIGRGRPLVQITKEQLLFLYNEGYTAPGMACLLKCSKSLIYKRLHQEGIRLRGKYSNAGDDELEAAVRETIESFPNSGIEVLSGLLRSKGIWIQRKKLRQLVSTIDPIGTATRWGNAVQRRVYNVPTPNSLWHIDAHLKLSRYGFVTHGCIDGQSRLIIYLKCTVSITAQTVLQCFVPAVENYGVPSRVRSDHGFENLFVAVLMNCLRGIGRGSHITGRSVHNQRIERLWRDVQRNVILGYCTKFMKMEEEGVLNIENDIHLYALQYVYLDEIQKALEHFKNGWNQHRIRTEGRKTPRQLWLNGVLRNYNTNHTAIQEIFREDANTLSNRTREYFANYEDDIVANEEHPLHPSRYAVNLDLNEDQRAHLLRIKSRDDTPIGKYTACVAFLAGE